MLALPLLLPSLTFNPLTPQPVAPSLPPAVIKVAQAHVDTPQFPSMPGGANYQDKTTAQVNCEASGGTWNVSECDYPPPPPAPVYEAPAPTYAAPQVPQGDTLYGSLGYALDWGNCVEEPGVNNPFDGTNPISWSVFTQTPAIGRSALFYFNHVAIVTGIWSNGDIEVRQRNWHGVPITRFPRSEIRGFR